ncbi:hypothetical protein INR49_015782, partial [Caranx melampygus]
MSLSAKDKAQVKKIWEKVDSKAADIGAEALGSNFKFFLFGVQDVGCLPSDQDLLFSVGSNLDVQNPQVRKHGAVIMGGIRKAVKSIDDLTGGLSALSELHAFKLRVDPANFKILAHNLILSIAMYFPADLTPEVHVSVDKFLQRVALALAEKDKSEAVTMVEWTDFERATIQDIFSQMDYESVGAAALTRCLVVYPWTQRYFGAFGNLYNASAIVMNPLIRKHGITILHGLDRAVKNMDNIKEAYAELSVLHSEKLHVDPDNFRLLADCLTIVLAARLGSAFTGDVQAAFQKFLAVVVSSLGRHEGQSQSSEELVHGHVDLRGEFIGEHDGQDHKDVVGEDLWRNDKHMGEDVNSKLKVSRVNPQSEGVQLTQAQETSFQIVEFGHSISDSVHHGDSVLLHRGRAGAQVLPVGEVGLGLRVDHQHPAEKMEMVKCQALVPMSSVFEDILAQKVLMVALSLSDLLTCTDKSEAVTMVEWTDFERATIQDIFSQMDYESVGAAALTRCLVVYPWTQRYFGGFGNLYNASAIVMNPLIRKHGITILHGLDRAVKNMDNIKEAYAELSVLHSEKLHVDPDNFRLLADCLTIVLAARLGSAFTGDVQAAFQKFLAVVVSSLGRHEGQSQSSEELVHGHVDLRGEFIGEHDGQDHEDVVGEDLWRNDKHMGEDVTSKLKVSRVNPQSEGVQLTQVQETSFQIVEFGHSISDSVHHGDSVLLHRGRAGAQVIPVGEIGLGLRVDHQHPAEKMEMVKCQRRRLCKVEVSVQKHSDVVLAGLQGDGQRSAAVLQQYDEDEFVKKEGNRKDTGKEMGYAYVIGQQRPHHVPSTVADRQHQRRLTSLQTPTMQHFNFIF